MESDFDNSMVNQVREASNRAVEVAICRKIECEVGILLKVEIGSESVTRFCTEPKAEHEALQAMRIEQRTEEWKERYNKRADIEGALAFGKRNSGHGIEAYPIRWFS